MKWPCRAVATVGIVLALASPSAAGQVTLVIRDGLVTLDAKDATLREILVEWARVGHTRVVNAERVSGGPVTVQLTDVPERQALDTLLRAAAGYLAVSRAASQASDSIYDRIVIMPGTRPTVTPASPSSSRASQQTPAASRDRVVSQPALVVDEEEERDPNVQMRMPGAAQPGMPAMQYQGPGGPGNPVQFIGPGGVLQAPARAAPPVPQAAPRPGMPTPQQTGPIKG